VAPARSDHRAAGHPGHPGIWSRCSPPPPVDSRSSCGWRPGAGASLPSSPPSRIRRRSNHLRRLHGVSPSTSPPPPACSPRRKTSRVGCVRRSGPGADWNLGDGGTCDTSDEAALEFPPLPGGSSSVGRASPSQGECREFEPRLPLHPALSLSSYDAAGHALNADATADRIAWLVERLDLGLVPASVVAKVGLPDE
jgi:hypothetical protein